MTTAARNLNRPHHIPRRPRANKSRGWLAGVTAGSKECLYYDDSINNSENEQVTATCRTVTSGKGREYPPSDPGALADI
jgi:hypothetical protein